MLQRSDLRQQLFLRHERLLCLPEAQFVLVFALLQPIYLLLELEKAAVDICLFGLDDHFCSDL